MRPLAVWLFALLAFAGTPAAAELPPRPDGPVLDQAAVIPDAEEAALNQRLRAYNAATGRAIIVATVSSLDGLEVADYAQTLAEKWDIGGAETEEAVLLLVAPNERTLRIHVGRGSQERLPDVLGGRIIRETIVPQFKTGNYGGGIIAGVDAITAQLDRAPADAKAIAEAAKAAGSGKEEASAGSVLFWIMLIGFFMLMFGGRRGRSGMRRSGVDPGIVLWGASEIARHMSSGGSGGFGGGGSSGGFGGFGGGGSGFDGGGASGDW
jgi:uncharacterized protein